MASSSEESGSSRGSIGQYSSGSEEEWTVKFSVSQIIAEFPANAEPVTDETMQESSLDYLIKKYSENLNKEQGGLEIKGYDTDADPNITGHQLKLWRQFLIGALQNVKSIDELNIYGDLPPSIWKSLEEILLNSGITIKKMSIDSDPHIPRNIPKLTTLEDLNLVWNVTEQQPEQSELKYYDELEAKLKAVIAILKRNPLLRVLTFSDYDELLWANLLGAIETDIAFYFGHSEQNCRFRSGELNMSLHSFADSMMIRPDLLSSITSSRIEVFNIEALSSVEPFALKAPLLNDLTFFPNNIEEPDLLQVLVDAVWLKEYENMRKIRIHAAGDLENEDECIRIRENIQKLRSSFREIDVAEIVFPDQVPVDGQFCDNQSINYSCLTCRWESTTVEP